MAGDNAAQRENRLTAADKLNHVGGVNDDLGGVDPEVDANLMRLFGGP